MIELKQDLLEVTINQALDRIHSAHDVQLISITKKVDQTDPLAFFDAAKNMNTTRIFWTSPDAPRTLVGIGNLIEIVAEANRLQITTNKWTEIKNKTIIHNPYNVLGTGLVILGGMAFDPEKPKTELWEHFSASQFHVPEFLLSIDDKGECYVTINAKVQQDTVPVELARKLHTKMKKLLNYRKSFSKDMHVVKKTEIEPERWKDTVRKATETMKQALVDKIVLAREMRLKLSGEVNIANILYKLLQTQPTSYVFAIVHHEDCFIGATPERLVKVEEEKLLSTCLAGTAPRGKTEQEDRKIAHELFYDEKNRQEHEFVVQMIKQSIATCCTDIFIPDEPIVYPLKNLQHLYTPVTAKLKKAYSIFSVVEKLHPTPALGGTPKEAALAFIREHELLDRGWYGAPIGWVDHKGNGEFAVAIRSGLIQGDEASLFAGCGVVEDSDPEAEYEETNIKFTPMLSVLEG